MTSQTGENRHGWRRAVTGVVASSALAIGLMTGFGSATAHADVVDDIAAEYDDGAGAGPVSKLIHDAVKLRALGYRPSKANMTALEEAMTKRPNQIPLIEALQETVAYQRVIQARSIEPPNPIVMGINELPPGVEPGPTQPGNGGGAFISPGGGVEQPIAP